MAQVHLYLLGAPRIERDGAPVAIDRRKALALLAYLETTRQRHTRDALAALLWPNDDGATARAALRRTLASLTSALGSEWFDTDREHIGLAAHPNWSSDLTAFRAASDDHSIQALEAKVMLYRGDFLAGFSLRDSAAFDEWQLFQADELRQTFTDTIKQLAQAYTHSRSWQQAITAARRWLSLDQLHEPAHRLLMELYAQSGQRGLALRQYNECVRVLQEELGSAPEPETTALYERVRSGALAANGKATNGHVVPIQTLDVVDWAGDEAPPAPIFSEPQTPFFGREEERTTVARFLRDPDCRLVTLLGPGGIGKTRLAAKVAREQHGLFADGAHIVSLVGMPPSGCLACTIGQALGITFYPSQSVRLQLFATLRHKELLLVLDNFEHLVEKAGLLQDLLANAPRMKILITSRERLRLSHEWALELGGLDVPPDTIGIQADQWSAMQLFVQTAQRTQADFALTSTNRADVIRICRLVEGVPLGIELAAAWVRMFGTAEIAREIAHNLDFLATSLRDVPPRHRSIRAAFEHSWNLLSAEEQTVFRRLAVFQGGFERAAAEDVAGATLATLAALADKSLLRRRSDGRFEVQELLRQYACEKLQASHDDYHAVRTRHCAYFCDLFSQYAQSLQAIGHGEMVRLFAPELENARWAWQWAVEQRLIDKIEQAAKTLYRAYEALAWLPEALHALRAAIEAIGTETTDPRERVLVRNLLGLRATFAASLGYFSEAEANVQQALALYSDSDDEPCEQAYAYHRLAKIYAYQGHFNDSIQMLQASIALRRATNDLSGVAKSLSMIVYALAEMGRFEEAHQLIEESLSLARAHGEVNERASTLNNLGYACYVMGDYAQAEALIEESLATWRAMDQWIGVAVAQTNMAFISIASRKWASAQQMLIDVLQTAQDMHMVPMGLDVLSGFAMLFVAEGNTEQAAGLLALILDHPASWHETRARALSLQDAIRRELPAPLFAAASERGRTRLYKDVAAELLLSDLEVMHE